ncbi:hypothetical protein BDV39DRAFT_187971, partial [Aspergillus sergii]
PRSRTNLVRAEQGLSFKRKKNSVQKMTVERPRRVLVSVYFLICSGLIENNEKKKKKTKRGRGEQIVKKQKKKIK